MANMERLNHVLEVIEANPDRHDQDHFRKVTHCGTTMCFAGWAVELYGEWLTGDLGLWRARYDDIVASPGQTAARILDLNQDQKDELFFNCSATLEDLKLTVQKIGEQQ